MFDQGGVHLLSEYSLQRQRIQVDGSNVLVKLKSSVEAAHTVIWI